MARHKRKAVDARHRRRSEGGVVDAVVCKGKKEKWWMLRTNGGVV